MTQSSAPSTPPLERRSSSRAKAVSSCRGLVGQRLHAHLARCSAAASSRGIWGRRCATLSRLRPEAPARTNRFCVGLRAPSACRAQPPPGWFRSRHRRTARQSTPLSENLRARDTPDCLIQAAACRRPAPPWAGIVNTRCCRIDCRRRSGVQRFTRLSTSARNASARRTAGGLLDGTRHESDEASQKRDALPPALPGFHPLASGRPGRPPRSWFDSPARSDWRTPR